MKNEPIESLNLEGLLRNCFDLKSDFSTVLYTVAKMNSFWCPLMRLYWLLLKSRGCRMLCLVPPLWTTLWSGKLSLWVLIYICIYASVRVELWRLDMLGMARVLCYIPIIPEHRRLRGEGWFGHSWIPGKILPQKKRLQTWWKFSLFHS